MPGASLWLLPPAGASQDPLFALIEKTSSHFGSPHRFVPHITLTSELSPNTYGQNPQTWLDSLEFDKAEVQVKFEKLDSENVFVRKLYIKCEKTLGLKQLAMRSRQNVEGFADTSKATDWAEDSYNPHMSLLYHDCPVIDEQGLAEVERFAHELGIDVHGKEGLSGWQGGRVVLVRTDQPIDQWNSIAERKL